MRLHIFLLLSFVVPCIAGGRLIEIAGRKLIEDYCLDNVVLNKGSNFSLHGSWIPTKFLAPGPSIKVKRNIKLLVYKDETMEQLSMRLKQFEDCAGVLCTDFFKGSYEPLLPKYAHRTVADMNNKFDCPTNVTNRQLNFVVILDKND